jgi:tRNA pseudouridine55 synthase
LGNLKSKQSIHGLLLIDKSKGISSNQVLTLIKRMLNPKKIGHTGTLDPLATGLLPICLGDATKFSSFLLDENKTYEADLQLGSISSTGDAEGKIKKINSYKIPSIEKINEILQSFLGESKQKPPMYSALKKDGIPLYKLARQGIEVDREERSIHIKLIDLQSIKGDLITIKVCCSKGTYIRTLGEDIGKKLGTGAYLTSLRRVAVGKIGIHQALTLDDYEKLSLPEKLKKIVPIDSYLDEFNTINLTKIETEQMKNGQILKKLDLNEGIYRLYANNHEFLGLGQIDSEFNLKVKRLNSLI